ncbi:metallophosphoesterase [Fictibacillus gelatini]|uniref:metallophosphoesterase n=1 Tax=Fictibacillus gelatini TaxID=225985 RepID=UPI0004263366|nr:metallophosphoesterase [Fictibacillus gelatini]
MIWYVLLFFVLLMILYKANKNTKKVEVNTISLETPDKKDSISKLTVLHLSDIHLENISVSPAELYEQIRHDTIDIIALTGDFLDRKRSIPKLVPYLQVLQKINPTHGTFAVFGNHDYVLKGEHFDRLKETLESNGCRTLQNENVTIEIEGNLLNIIGIDDYSTNRSNLAQSFEGVKEGYNLVLTHDPNVVLEMDNFHFDYLLSGHFHGGQIHWPKPYHLKKMGKLVGMNMIKGLHYHKGKPFYISEGLGQTGVNIRIGSRPEITLHQLS